MEKQLIQEIELLHHRMCKGINDSKRLMILYALAEKPRYVSELAVELDTPQSTISRHLKVLRDLNMVETAREGAAVYYSLTDERVIQALDLLRDVLKDRIMAEARLVEVNILDSRVVGG